MNPPNIWVVGNEQIRPLHMQNLVAGKIIADGVIDGFFFCYLTDHLVRTGASVANLPFHIAGRDISEPLIIGPRAKDRDQGMAPPQPSNSRRLGPRKLWFEKVSFVFPSLLNGC